MVETLAQGLSRKRFSVHGCLQKGAMEAADELCLACEVNHLTITTQEDARGREGRA